MPTDPLAPLVAAVFDPAAAPHPCRLRPVVFGRPRPLVRLPRRRRAGVVRPPFCRHSWSCPGSLANSGPPLARWRKGGPIG